MNNNEEQLALKERAGKNKMKGGLKQQEWRVKRAQEAGETKDKRNMWKVPARSLASYSCICDTAPCKINGNRSDGVPVVKWYKEAVENC
jgi:hypothetical protein